MPMYGTALHGAVNQYSTHPVVPQDVQLGDLYVRGDVAARVYALPDALDLCRVEPVPALTLGLLTQGALWLEERSPHSPWHCQLATQGNLSLRAAEQEPHERRWRGCSTEPIQAIDVYVPQKLLVRVTEELAGQDAVQQTVVGRTGFQDPLLMQLGLALVAALQQPTPIDELYVQTATHMLAVHLIRFYGTQGARIWEPVRGLSETQVQRVHAYVQSHIGHDLTLAVLAKQIGLSAYHFARMFRLATGESPHQAVMRQRIERAQWLLRTTNTPIIDVAMQCGFANQSYLTTVFKRHLGLTPRAYRRLVQ